MAKDTESKKAVKVEEVKPENSPVLGEDEQSTEDTLEQARREALANHEAEHPTEESQK